MQPLPDPYGDIWSRFTVDPRRQPSVRASDADRDVAAQALNAAFTDGRLDQFEHAERLEQALAAKQVGQLVPLVADLVVSASAAPAARQPAGSTVGGMLRSGAVRSWLVLAILFNAIWIATWLFSGHAPYYYWPIWPMIGTGIPVLIAWMAGGAMGSSGSKQLPWDQGGHGRPPQQGRRIG